MKILPGVPFVTATIGPPAATDAAVKPYTTDEVAALTRTHPATLRAAVARGEFPAPVRVGQKLLWPRAAVDAFLSGAGVLTAARAGSGEPVRTAVLR